MLFGYVLAGSKASMWTSWDSSLDPLVWLQFSDVMLLHLDSGEAGHADGEQATGRGWGGAKEAPEGISVNGLTLKVGFGQGEQVVGDPKNGGGGESEPMGLGD